MAPLNASMSLPVGVLFFNCFMLTGASIFVAMRFWSRWKKRTTLQVNDYTIIISWVGQKQIPRKERWLMEADFDISSDHSFEFW